MIYINRTGKQNQVWMPKPYDIIINDCPEADDAYNSGYTSGVTDGIAEQKAKLVSTAITENGTYTKEDGFSSVEVNVPTGQTINNQVKSYSIGKWQTTLIQTGEDKYMYTLINRPTILTYDSGYTGLEKLILNMGIDASDSVDLGKILQKAKMVSTAITENGTYTRDDGWNRVTVNVASGYTQDDLDRAFQSGYTAGLRACSGFTPAADLTLNAASAITGTGQASVTVTPSEAGTDITYTSSDPSKATIYENGAITVVGNGNVTFCAIDAITELQDCKTVAVSLPAPANTNVLDFTYVTTGANQTIWLFGGDAQDSNAYFYQFYSAITRMDIDGIPVEKSASNIHVSNPSSVDYYFYQFANAGRHNVKYYMSKNYTAALQLQHLVFSDNNAKLHLVEANIGSGYQILGTGAFQGTAELTAVTIPNTVKSIGPYTFEYSGIKELTIPNSVTALTYESWMTTGYGIFNNCSALTSVTIGTGLSTLPGYTFDSCTALRNVTMNRTTPPTLGSNCFRNCTSLQHIYVPASSVNAYKTATGWSNYASIISAKP